MPRFMVAGNWKMYGSCSSIHSLIQSLSGKASQGLPQGLDEMAVFPPAIFIADVAKNLQDGPIAWGGQDTSDQAEGAYTGQVSAAMLKEYGCQYTLVGHSERRAINGESSELIADKFVAAQTAGLVPVLCIGESQEERESGQTEAILRSQLLPVIEKAGIDAIANSVLAYEPVWAIGTGLAATPEIAEAAHSYCRNFLAEYNDAIAGELTILYGGSVKPDNAAALFAKPNINGALVGGASLKAEDFWHIAQAAEASVS